LAQALILKVYQKAIQDSTGSPRPSHELQILTKSFFSGLGDFGFFGVA
jgi:hypothetical protein